MNIRSACYSNIHVYEMPVRGIPVMIRKTDKYVNATQVLRAAGLPKPARTKVLEREVTRGIHEKVQGGYAGSQGTWIPLNSAIELATTYKVINDCLPLFNYDMASGYAESISPPLKVKRVVQPKIISEHDVSSSDEKVEKRPKAFANEIPVKREQRESRIRSRRNINFVEGENEEEYSSSQESLKAGQSPRKYRKVARRNASTGFTSNSNTGQSISGVEHSAGPLDSTSTKVRTCENCGANETPQWRRGPSGKRTLCNACEMGIRKIEFATRISFPFL
ncbi:transcription regulator HTH, apses-type DNA-binding domain-containing protein [Globomyces pollinis-pini]|nr:transcription regulator HTH, apses-type DNA-binding domain-containing protein [Globomyces pollinis-pini]